ncbi:hypothetical protein AB0L34_02320 [Micromonospora sp. NPDC052213]|uniref:hypothetical protein n=1 Tax=Micromonospora sp. NPDC052213 TaxID=3155812 RepID=UPI00341A6B2E
MSPAVSRWRGGPLDLIGRQHRQGDRDLAATLFCRAAEAECRALLECADQLS